MPKPTFFNLPDEKRQQILEVVIDEFAEHNYADASISRIVARAGIAKGSFYQYFEGKQDLYDYLFDLVAQAKTEMLSLDHPDPGRVGIFAYMRWLLESSVEFELRYPRFGKIGYRLLNDANRVETMMAKGKAAALPFYQQLVKLGKQQGDIAPDIDEELAALMFHGLMIELGRFMVTRVTELRGTDWQGTQGLFDFPEVKKIFEQALRILEHGMRGEIP